MRCTFTEYLYVRMVGYVWFKEVKEDLGVGGGEGKWTSNGCIT